MGKVHQSLMIEIVAFDWIEPSRCLEAFNRSEIRLLLPQICILSELATLSFDQLSSTVFTAQPILPELDADGNIAIPGVINEHGLAKADFHLHWRICTKSML